MDKKQRTANIGLAIQWLIGCDSEFNTHTDFYYDELDQALDDAKRIYQNDNINWTQIN
jgi:hypothetical protein